MTNVKLDWLITKDFLLSTDLFLKLLAFCKLNDYYLQTEKELKFLVEKQT